MLLPLQMMMNLLRVPVVSTGGGGGGGGRGRETGGARVRSREIDAMVEAAVAKLRARGEALASPTQTAARKVAAVVRRDEPGVSVTLAAILDVLRDILADREADEEAAVMLLLA